MIATTVTIPKGARMIDSVRRFTPTEIRSLGAIGTCRYYAPRRGDGSRNPKCLTPSEIAELHAGRIAIVPNWESSATRPLGGASAGSIDGHEFARQLVLDEVPDEALVIVSCDMNAIPSGKLINRPSVEAYFRAALGELARVGYRHQGVYGDTDLFRWLADLDLVGWLMVSPSFSDGTKYGTHIWQRYQGTWNVPRTEPLAGIPNNSYDPNDVLVDVPGVWLPHVVPEHIDTLIPPTPHPQEADMPAIVTNQDAYADENGTHDAYSTKWEYIGGEKVHISFEYWNGIGTPDGNPRPYAEIAAVPDRAAPSAAAPSDCRFVAAPTRFVTEPA